MLSPESMKPQGLAIRDYWHGDEDALIIMHGDDGEDMEVPAAVYFREYHDWPLLERTAVDLCCGRVLDLGAGAGCHSLVLQERGLEVCAIDISPECADVMKECGVKDVHLANVFDFEAEPFETILMMMNGIGFVETLDGLDSFLKYISRLVKTGGQILLDSFDARTELDPREARAIISQHDDDYYFGEVELWLEYKDYHGPKFGWLYVDTETLKKYAKKNGWGCRIVQQEEDGAYLAQLTRI